MTKIRREARRLLVQARHILAHGTPNPYPKTRRVGKPSILTHHPEWEIRAPLEFIVAHLQKRWDEFFFIQLGTYDGSADDALHDLIRKYHCRGILVEPQPDAFRRLQHAFADEPQLILENVAIGEKDGTLPFYSLPGATQMASFDRGHLVRHAVSSSDIEEYAVPCLTLASLLSRHQCDQVDLLQIDVEGHDAVILRSIDFDSVRPSIIRYEHIHLLPAERNDCIEMLAAQGYRIMLEDTDTIAYHGLTEKPA